MSIETSKFFTITFFVIIMMITILRYMENKEKKYCKNSEKKDETIIYDPDGSATEFLVRQKLKALFGFRPAVSVLLPAGEINTEIDLVQSTTKGVFVVECKSRTKAISGDVKADYWAVGASEKAMSMENPIKQNFYHVKAVQKYLRTELDKIPVYSVIVVLSAGLNIKGLDSISETKLFKDIQSLESLKQLPDVISHEKAKELQELIYQKEGTVKQLEKHVQDVKRKYETS